MAPRNDSMQVIGYLAGPRKFVRQIAADYGVQQTPKVRVDGVIYTSTDPLDQVSADLLITQFANENESARLIPITTEVSAGAQTFSYIQVTDVGQARVIVGDATDVPQVDVEVEKFQQSVISHGAYYAWTIQDQDAAELARSAGYPIDMPSEKARAALTAQARACSETGLVGIPALSISGLFNEPTISSLALPNGDWANPATTTAEILADADAVVSAVFSNTLQRWRADVLLVGSQAYSILQSRYRGDGTDQTLLRAIEAAYPGLTVETSAWLDRSDVGSGGTIFAYAKDPDVLRQEIPIVYREQPAQQHGYRVKVFTDSIATGCIVRRPAAIVAGTGAIV